MVRETAVAAAAAVFASGLTYVLVAGSDVPRGSPPAVPTHDPDLDPVTDPAVCGASEGMLRDEIAELRRELAAAKLQGALAHGQLISHEGIPQEWPPDAPSSLHPEPFREEVVERLRANESLALVDMDCSEFPCIAVVRSEAARASDSTEDWVEPVRTLMRDIAVDAYGDGFIMLGESAVRAISGPSGHHLEQPGFVAMTIVPSGDDELKQRVQYRARSLASEYHQ